jgi:hypothetical protein
MKLSHYGGQFPKLYVFHLLPPILVHMYVKTETVFEIITSYSSLILSACNILILCVNERMNEWEVSHRIYKSVSDKSSNKSINLFSR